MNRNRQGRDDTIVETSRPQYALESHEDELYHELRVKDDLAHAPEFYAFLDHSWVFNRAMRWIETPGGGLICHEAAGDLLLSGRNGVSEWFTGPGNDLRHAGDETRFEKKSSRRRDCVVLPGFQFNVQQHPVVEVEMFEARGNWQFCALIKGRSGPPFLAGVWESGPGRARF
ncbi:hypothetical protein HQ520_08805, partial [bacterium]|nr:hypothetical protein [bacterium]